MNDSPLVWLTGFNAAMATFNGIFLSWLAYRNHQVSRNQLKLALYDRRYRVYEAVKQLLVDATKTDSLTLDSVAAYLRGTTEARFLFDPPAIAFMDGIRKKALAWRQQMSEAEAHAPGTAARAQAEAQAKAIQDSWAMTGLPWLGPSSPPSALRTLGEQSPSGAGDYKRSLQGSDDMKGNDNGGGKLNIDGADPDPPSNSSLPGYNLPADTPLPWSPRQWSFPVQAPR